MRGGGIAALSLCGKKEQHHFLGSRPPKDATAPQMVVRSYAYYSAGVSDPGRIIIHLSIASGSERPLILTTPLGTEGAAVEVEGPDGVQLAAYNLPVKIRSSFVDKQLKIGPTTPADVEVVVPPAAACPGHSLSKVKASSTGQGGGTSTLTVAISDPAIARYRAAHGAEASSDLLVATWPSEGLTSG